VRARDCEQQEIRGMSNRSSGFRDYDGHEVAI
jgi:hypothetical protein